MSGHNKWSTIKHKKAAADAKRGKVFSKIAREIVVAVQTGGGEEDKNPSLRLLMQKARSVNMPADNVERAVKKGTGELQDDVIMEELVYEGYAPGGVGVVVLAVTDNKNRTAAEVRHAFTRHNNNMAGQGSVSRLFNRKGLIEIDAAKADEEKVMEIALEAGAEDMQSSPAQYTVTTDPSTYVGVVDALNNAGIEIANAEVTLLPETTIPVTDKSQASAILRFIDTLDELDDVQDVFSNYEIDDELMEQISADE